VSSKLWQTATASVELLIPARERRRDAKCALSGPQEGTGGSQLTGLVVNSKSITVSGAPHQTVKLPNGKLVLNEQSVARGRINVNAVHTYIYAPLSATEITDVVAASAAASVRCPLSLGRSRAVYRSVVCGEFGNRLAPSVAPEQPPNAAPPQPRRDRRHRTALERAPGACATRHSRRLRTGRRARAPLFEAMVNRADFEVDLALRPTAVFTRRELLDALSAGSRGRSPFRRPAHVEVRRVCAAAFPA